jgi:hypothetical protein
MTVQELINRLVREQPVEGWPPEDPPRPLYSFDDLPQDSPEDTERLIQSDDPTDRLRALRAWYRNGEYRRILGKLGKVGNEAGSSREKLILLLAYLQLSRGIEDPRQFIEKHAKPVLNSTEPAGFKDELSDLRNWFDDFLRGGSMP